MNTIQIEMLAALRALVTEREACEFLLAEYDCHEASDIDDDGKAQSPGLWLARAVLSKLKGIRP